MNRPAQRKQYPRKERHNKQLKFFHHTKRYSAKVLKMMKAEINSIPEIMMKRLLSFFTLKNY